MKIGSIPTPPRRSQRKFAKPFSFPRLPGLVMITLDSCTEQGLLGFHERRDNLSSHLTTLRALMHWRGAS